MRLLYRSPELTYDPVTNRGQKYLYFSFGAACTEVEIDCLTGDHTVCSPVRFIDFVDGAAVINRTGLLRDSFELRWA
jgi:xanthine dehydrogenase molybdopterin-binding subunit B